MENDRFGFLVGVELISSLVEVHVGLIRRFCGDGFDIAVPETRTGQDPWGGMM